jgi:HK97 family phage prohead protease
MAGQDNIEWREAAEVRAAGRRLEGLAAVFDQEADLSGFREVIRRGAFRRSLKSGDVLALVDHDRSKLLARTRSGTLRLEEDARGLVFSIDLPDTQPGRDVLALAERGDLGGMSFGFTVPKGGETFDGDTRELIDIDLREISIVSAWPAYEGTSVSARSKRPRLARLERFLETV